MPAKVKKKSLTPLYTRATRSRTKLVDYWPVKKSLSGHTGKRRRMDNPENAVNPTCQPSRGISFKDLPIELVLNVLHFCSPDDILSLSQVSLLFRRICSYQYLCRIGIIIKNGMGSAQICLVGPPFSPSAVSFLPDADLRALRISLICDLFHASSFSSHIIHFLRNHSVVALEMRFLEDELDILEDPSFPDVVQSILSAITPTCKRVSFSSHGGRLPRTLPTPYRMSSPSQLTQWSTSKFRKLIDSVTEFRLSSVFSPVGPLWDTLSHFLQISTIEIVTLDCDISEDSWRILQSMAMPGLEMLNIVTHCHSPPVFPTGFNKHHPKLKFLTMVNLRSWNTPDSLQLPTIHLSLPTLSHLAITSNYSSFKIQDVVELSRLSIVSFMTLPVPENRGYCNVVASLARTLRSSTSQHFSSSLTVSFTFPRFLDAHLRFCEENPVYQCSCSEGSLVKNIRNIEVHADTLSEVFVGYICTWIRQFPQVVHLNIFTDRLSISDQLPPLSSFRLYCQQLLDVTFCCSGEGPLSLK